jgi:hypothetical protein
MFCHGFDVTIDYLDGVYIDNSGKAHGGQHVVLTNTDLGIDRGFSETADLRRLLTDCRNEFLIRSKWEDLNQRLKFYREDLEEERKGEEVVMNPSFWVLVFNNQHMPPRELQDYLTTHEHNPALRNIMRNRKLDFESLYARLRYFDTHPALGFWYTFWDDVFTNNMFMKQLQKNAEFFDMTSKWAIAYNPVSIPRLKENLEKLGLRTKKGGGLFKDEILDKLEAKLTELGASDMRPLRTYVIPGSAAVLNDPRATNTILLPENAMFLAQAAAITLDD